MAPKQESTYSIVVIVCVFFPNHPTFGISVYVAGHAKGQGLTDPQDIWHSKPGHEISQKMRKLELSNLWVMCFMSL